MEPFRDATDCWPIDGAPGRYGAEIHDGWDIGGNANGGYLLAIAGRAMAAASGRARPASITAHYLSPGKPGPVEIDTRLVKSGKSYVTVGASLRAGDRPVLELVGSFTDLEPSGSSELVDGGPPDLPAVEECPSRQPNPENNWPPPFMNRIDLRLHPDDVARPTGERSGRALVRGWFRLPDDQPIDAITLLQVSDAFPPTIFNVDLPIGWVPTLELTVHVRAQPARAGCGAASPPASCPTACSRRTARSGTRRGDSSRCLVSWRWFPASRPDLVD